MSDEKTMRAVLGLKPGQRAANQDLAYHREYYQHSMKEYRDAEAWWGASTLWERAHYTKVHHLEWQFLSALEHMLATVYLLNCGQVAADLEYEAEQRRRHVFAEGR